MRTLSKPPHLALASCAAAALLAGCSSAATTDSESQPTQAPPVVTPEQQEQQPDTPANLSTQSEAVSAPEGEQAAATPTAEAVVDTVGECVDERPYYHQRYGNGVEGITATGDDVVPRFYYTVTDGGYDPCARISYSVLTGSFGGLERPGGTGASMGQGIIVWLGSYPVNARGLTAASIDNVSVVNDTSIRATFGRRGGATAEGVTERATVTLRVEYGQLVPVEGDIELYNSIVRETPGIIP